MQRNRRIELRTLVIASIASAAAAALTSQFWIRGTPYAAALTPLIIALVSEILHRPTDRLAVRLRGEGEPLPEASAAASPPAPEKEDLAPPARPLAPEQPRQPVTRRHIAWAAVLTTGLLAFVIGATALTVTELVAGGSIGKGDRQTSLVPGGGAGDGSADPPAPPVRTIHTTTVIRTVPRKPGRTGVARRRDRAADAPSRRRRPADDGGRDSPRRSGQGGAGQGGSTRDRQTTTEPETTTPSQPRTTPTAPDRTTAPSDGSGGGQPRSGAGQTGSGGLQAGDG